MTYAIYTRSHPADTGCKADRGQYQRCLDFAARYRLGKSLPHYSDTLVLSANGETNGLQNLFEDIRFGQIDGVIIEDTIFFGENSTRLMQIIDFLPLIKPASKSSGRPCHARKNNQLCHLYP